MPVGLWDQELSYYSGKCSHGAFVKPIIKKFLMIYHLRNQESQPILKFKLLCMFNLDLWNQDRPEIQPNLKHNDTGLLQNRVLHFQDCVEVNKEVFPAHNA
jgi:hypothetical protein